MTIATKGVAPTGSGTVNDDSASSTEDLYRDSGCWEANLGDRKVHARRMPGKYRTLKWSIASLYLLYFLGPFIRWEGRQAIFFDIPHRKYHIFAATLWPQDVWVLSLALLGLFLTLYAVTLVAGRVFCGYFCWQTVWTDVYTWIEEKIEGPPQRRRALDDAPWSMGKALKKGAKTAIYLVLGTATGVTFTSYFIDVFDLWHRYVTLRGPVSIWVAPVPFIVGTWLGVGIMREQLCFWLCPYARIQGALQDADTIVPSYDRTRGEPRGRLRNGENGGARGDCVACNLCVGACPTGIDIRDGMQEGCIMCALCLDACDSMMAKVGKPKKLIRYASLNELAGKPVRPLFTRPRVMLNLLLLVAVFSGIVFGFSRLGGVRLNVVHERQPLYILESDGSIQNMYTLRVLNRSEVPLNLTVALSELPGARLESPAGVIHVKPGGILPITAAVKIPRGGLRKESTRIEFHLLDAGTGHFLTEAESRFLGPGKF